MMRLLSSLDGHLHPLRQLNLPQLADQLRVCSPHVDHPRMDALGILVAKLLGPGRQGRRDRRVRVALVDQPCDFLRRPVDDLRVVGGEFNP